MVGCPEKKRERRFFGQQIEIERHEMLRAGVMAEKMGGKAFLCAICNTVSVTQFGKKICPKP